MQDPEKEREYREEAERLRLLARRDQEDIVRMYRHKAGNRKLTAEERREAMERHEALARLLKVEPSV